ncbi:Hypothetical predicted protein [Olea europaea subsp. europaea]|uniref:Disease resistance protein At4g27190-like leucine-rich repeats domain-containing protein n=1 Tax=Olea europaea subsp. europaea TaxID=158383 RepID=A0A8S0U0R2_OLEEU|nr:Hypothetical predicted protein [Olea europaea subsp. europaea]
MTFEIFGCGTIRSLFPKSIAKCLVNLQSLEIFNCHMLAEVVSADARENEVTKICERLEFPKLRIVNLSSLTQFKSFTSQSNSGFDRQTLFNQVNFPNVECMDVKRLDCTVKLIEFDSIQSLQSLEYLHVLECKAFQVLFDFEGMKVTNDDAEINMLGRLETLLLTDLPQLVNIKRMVPEGIRVFQNLTNLDVTGCESLRYLFSLSIVNSLVALEELSIDNCKALEEIIGREEEENTSETRNIVMDANTPSNLHHFTQVVSMDAKRNGVIDMLEFPKLNSLVLIGLSNFKSFRFESNNDSII